MPVTSLNRSPSMATVSDGQPTVARDNTVATVLDGQPTVARDDTVATVLPAMPRTGSTKVDGDTGLERGRTGETFDATAGNMAME